MTYQLDELVASAKAGGDAPSAADRERVKRALARRLEVESQRISGPVPIRRKRPGLAVKFLLAAAVLVVGTASAYEVRKMLRHASLDESLRESHVSEPGPTNAPATGTAAAASVAPSGAPPVESSAPVAEPLSTAATPVGTRPTVNHAATTKPSGTADELLTAEMALVQSARSQLRNGAPADALATVDRYDARYPKGTFRQETAALRVLSLCDLGRVDEARTRAKAFERTWPKAPMLARVQASCAGDRGAKP
ncbi:hypothetical protein AKJ09_02750 [Labilithrix luteola]|uniref:Outer membrane lipoprotein BamD-like domain-containing protein n=1 Tax=Labilithrix luteola TaxID=1391654 RepID=A0A0K1PRR6_9BACT|nr:hypothetical protein [Labilithrix luteola]AKU96086.1 hypothetical protein AKJ09_02750 [Labilithrix luteola]